MKWDHTHHHRHRHQYHYHYHYHHHPPTLILVSKSLASVGAWWNNCEMGLCVEIHSIKWAKKAQMAAYVTP